jgi:transaldolase
MLCSARQYRAAAEAYLRGLERRAAARLDLRVGSIASMSLSGWDLAGPIEGSAVAIGRQAYGAYRALLRSPRWQRLLNAGARPQRLLWTSAKADAASEFLTARALAAPFTINVLSPESLRRFAAGGWLYTVGAAAPRGWGGALARLAAAGVQVEDVARKLQQEAMAAERTSWCAAVAAIASKGAELRQAS